MASEAPLPSLRDLRASVASPTVHRFRIAKVVGVPVTLGVLAGALGLAARLWREYDAHPWTRDAQVRAQIVSVAPQVKGPVRRIAVRENEPVQRGQLLFEIDQTDYEIALRVARANRDKLHADAEIARKTYDRRQRLATGNVISTEEFDTAEAAWRSARAQAEGAEAGMRQAEQNLAYCRVVSPVNGYVSGITFDVGAYAQAGAPLFAVVDRDSFWVSAIFKETALPALLPGRRVRMWFAPLPGRAFEGTVESTGWAIASADFATQAGLPDIAPTVDWVRLTRRFPVRVRLGEEAAALPLKVGATASVKVLPDATP